MSTLLLLLAVFLFGSAARAQSATVQFHIPAADAEKALTEFVSQTGIQMLYDPDDVRGFTTRPVSGALTVADALRQMLEGSDLNIQFEDDFQFVSIRPVGKAVAGTGGTGSASTDIDTRSRTVGRASQQFPSDEPEIQEVVITGTYLHGVFDVISPLEQVTRREMNQSSYATVQDVLGSLPMSFGGAPSENTGGTGNFARGTAVNLRGLGAGATLVLLNGHRLPYSGTEGDFVDVSTIPRNAINRIEVLPDGASALYGSDAIAGVVNIILQDDLDGNETIARFGASPAGASEKLVSQMSGLDWGTGHALISYQYSERSALAAADRDYLESTDKRALGGTDHRTYTNTPGNILNPGTLQPAFGILPGVNGVTLSNAINLNNQNELYEQLPQRRSHSVSLSGAHSLGEHFELFGDALISKRDTTQTLFGLGLPLFVPQSNAFYMNPFPEVPFTVVGYNFANDLGPMHIRTSSDTGSATVGFNAMWGEHWNLKVSESYGRDRMRFVVDNQPDSSALDAALADSDPATAFNPFNNGFTTNPATIEKIRTAMLGNVTSEIRTTSAILDGPIYSLASGQVKLAIGAEQRRETLDRHVFSNATFGRTINSAFAELSVPIVGAAGDPYAVPRLELSLAGRHESYNDFGTTTNPKVGLRWVPLKSVKFRTSWGTSFRAPKLVDLYSTAQNNASLLSVPDPLSPSGVSVVIQMTGNNPHLKEETASTWVTGLDFAPTFLPGFTASLSYFAIDYKNQVSVPSLASQRDILLEESQSGSRIQRNPSLERINAICNSSIFFGQPDQCANTKIAAIVDYGPQNMARTRVQGVDMKLEQLLDTSHGNFRLGLNSTYMFSFDRAGSSASPWTNVLDTVANPLGLKMRATAEWFEHDWDLPGWGISAALDHAGSYQDVIAQPRRGVSSWTTMDTRLSYRTARDSGAFGDVELGLNVANLFDEAPPFVDTDIGFDAANASPYGRVISLTVQKKW